MHLPFSKVIAFSNPLDNPISLVFPSNSLNERLSISSCLVILSKSGIKYIDWP